MVVLAIMLEIGYV